MRRSNRALLLAMAVATTACGDLLSLHGLYTPERQVFDSTLEGAWEREDDRLFVQRSTDGYSVRAEDQRDASDVLRYEVHLADVNGVRFADLRQEDTIGHLLVRIRTVDGELHLAFLETAWLRDRIPHENADVERGHTRTVLTIPTEKLRELVSRFALEPRAYGGELFFRRKPAMISRRGGRSIRVTYGVACSCWFRSRSGWQSPLPTRGSPSRGGSSSLRAEAGPTCG